MSGYNSRGSRLSRTSGYTSTNDNSTSGRSPRDPYRLGYAATPRANSPRSSYGSGYPAPARDHSPDGRTSQRSRTPTPARRDSYPSSLRSGGGYGGPARERYGERGEDEQTYCAAPRDTERRDRGGAFGVYDEPSGRREDEGTARPRRPESYAAANTLLDFCNSPVDRHSRPPFTRQNPSSRRGAEDLRSQNTAPNHQRDVVPSIETTSQTRRTAYYESHATPSPRSSAPRTPDLYFPTRLYSTISPRPYNSNYSTDYEIDRPSNQNRYRSESRSSTLSGGATTNSETHSSSHRAYGSHPASDRVHGSYSPSDRPHGSYSPSERVHGSYSPSDRTHGSYSSEDRSESE
ncbi:uncharacterized protein LTR77_004438 [Saxophila tyrrhenica]|uniref:Uncharacterized protein n=1 Tax=Saxophila tyrrhenica TaxID=1690608 RepID=A0AAV9PF85_9PEZI|nr:hypothetical protein LTR77_004438 [Saxophila tyrrhenica]